MSIIKSNAVAPPPSGGLSSISEMNSLRFDGSSHLSRTPTTAGNRKTWTWSGWVKREGLGTDEYIFGTSGTAPVSGVYFKTDNTIRWRTFNGTTENVSLATTQVFRDSSAWYHIVVAYDTNQATSSNRLNFYINGEQVTSFSSPTYPTPNYEGGMNATARHEIGAYYSTGISPFSGYLANIQFIDGQVPTTANGGLDADGNLQWFGETVSDIWVPKQYGSGDPSNASQVLAEYGTNGFHLDFADANNIGNDVSGRGNHWTAN